MIYRVIGLMSGSSLDGLDMAFVEFEEKAGIWSYNLRAAHCVVYPDDWIRRLQNATNLNAHEYLNLHVDYGHWLGARVNEFIHQHQLEYQVQLISSHGHTTFHSPALKLTAQLGDGAAIAAETGVPVITDLRSMDVANGGQGAPVVPIGEKLLWSDYDLFLNLGGIANLTAGASVSNTGEWLAFDVCPANRVLNMLAARVGKLYDENGELAADGKLVPELFTNLNALDYYGKPYPKSLANEFGTGIVFPLVTNYDMSTEDTLFTYCEHIAEQVAISVRNVTDKEKRMAKKTRMLMTGGGAFNLHLAKRISEKMTALGVETSIPETELISYKEALVMALMGVLRWRDEINTMASVTGAIKDSVNGAIWMAE